MIMLDPAPRCTLPRVAARLLLALLLGLSFSAAAHTTKLSSAQIALAGREADVVLLLNGADVDAALKSKLAGPDGQVAQERLAAVTDAVLGYVVTHSHISNSGGGTCSSRLLRLAAEAEHVRVAVRWTCPPVTGSLTYTSTLFHEIDPATRQMVSVTGAATRIALLSVAAPQVTLAATRSDSVEVFGHYLLAGIEHIVIGYDHVAFLVAVILWGRRLWPLVGVVTAFTLAHSVTLSLAVLGWVTPPTRVVEVLIALSIVYVAAENFWVRDLRRRWIATFAFGLVHGFGFAGVLREYGIPGDALVPALAAFNVGVELGQFAIVLLALATLRAIEGSAAAFQPAPNRRLVYPISAAVLMLGLYWTIERIFFA